MLVGYAGFLGIYEILQLKVRHVTMQEDHVVFFLPKKKRRSIPMRAACPYRHVGKEDMSHCYHRAVASEAGRHACLFKTNDAPRYSNDEPSAKNPGTVGNIQVGDRILEVPSSDLGVIQVDELTPEDADSVAGVIKMDKSIPDDTENA